jgi:hypothetical protein
MNTQNNSAADRPDLGGNGGHFAYRVKPESDLLKTGIIVTLVSLAIAVMMFLVWIYNLLESIHITF